MPYSVYMIDCPDHDGGISREGSKIYFGQTSQRIRERISSHGHASSMCPHIRNWLQARGREGFAVRVTVLAEDLEKDKANALEIDLISACAGKYRLMNLTAGGGGRAGVAMSPETKAKLRAAQLGKPKSAEARARMSAAQTGLKRTFSAEHRKKLSEAAKGRKFSKETRAKISAALTGRTIGPLPEEWRKNISAAAVLRRIKEKAAAP